jgi:hypothetical protein
LGAIKGDVEHDFLRHSIAAKLAPCVSSLSD